MALSKVLASGRQSVMSARAASVGLGPPTSRRERQAATLFNLSSTQVNTSLQKESRNNVQSRRAPRPRSSVRNSGFRGNVAKTKRVGSTANSLPRLKKYPQVNQVPTSKTIMSSERIKNVMRVTWYRFRAQVRDSQNSMITLGKIYTLSQQYILGLDTEQMSALLADAMGGGTTEAGNQANDESFDNVQVKVADALRSVEKYIQRQWDKVCMAISDMDKTLTLGEAHSSFLKHGLKLSLEEICHLPDWSMKSASGGLFSLSSHQLLKTSRINLSDRVEKLLKDKIKACWRRMNSEFRKVALGKQGFIDARQLNAVLSKFGIQLSHDDLMRSFSMFDTQGSGQ